VKKEELLTPAEIETIGRAAARAGFRKIRLTGGEPTLRPDMVEIVRRLAAVPGIGQVVMTTNGIRLPGLAPHLRAAGLSRVNVHLDTLNPERLPHLMRRGHLDRAWAGILAAEEAGLIPLKLNAAVTRGHNDMDVAGLARLTLEHPWQVRFIELMPLGTQAHISLERYVSSAETMQRIEGELGPLLPVDGDRLDGEARVYRLAGAPGTVGFISPVSQPYCAGCNRMRITADGRMRLCLLSDREIDFRRTLRGGGSVDDLVTLFEKAIRRKPWGHKLDKGEHPEARTMSQIGG
jgi:cyclic pyranopterin phosphate synthase